VKTERSNVQQSVTQDSNQWQHRHAG